jgi:hypothetical protein
VGAVVLGYWRPKVGLEKVWSAVPVVEASGVPVTGSIDPRKKKTTERRSSWWAAAHVSSEVCGASSRSTRLKYRRTPNQRPKRQNIGDNWTSTWAGSAEEQKA